jgi:hypothetical protein
VKSISILIPVLLLAASISRAAPAGDPERGQALAHELRTQRPAGPTASTGVLRLRYGNGRRVTLPVRVEAQLDTTQWQTVYHTAFSDGRKETLTVITSQGEPPRFVLHRVSRDGKLSEVRPERPDQLFTAFAGTDFWLIDLGMAFLHWPDQRWIGREKRRTRSCNMLESWNPMPSPGAYSRVVTWVDEETYGIVRAEAYDFRNRLLKEFSPGSFARVGSRYELRDMEIRNVQTDARTILQFNVEDPDKLSLKHLP